MTFLEYLTAVRDYKRLPRVNVNVRMGLAKALAL